jgi:cellobiose-specific phosphotransferase system component IIC
MILKYGGVLTHAGRKQVGITSHVQVSVIWLSHYLMNSMDTLPIQLTKMLCVILHFFFGINGSMHCLVDSYSF